MIDEKILIDDILEHLTSRPGNKECAEQISEIIRIIKQQQVYQVWISTFDKLPKYDGEYETTVKTLEGYKSIAPGVVLNVRMVFSSGVWKNQWFQEVPFWKVIAWKEIDEPYQTEGKGE